MNQVLVPNLSEELPRLDPKIRIEYRPCTKIRHEFQAIAFTEEDGGFSVVAENYPGVISQGDTLTEAKENIADAFLQFLTAHKQLKQQLSYTQRPWFETNGTSHRFRVKCDD
jgi:predicted RNase H-like HicB family nuclease